MFSKNCTKILVVFAIPVAMLANSNGLAQEKEAMRAPPIAELEMNERQGRREKTEQVNVSTRIDNRIRNRLENRIDRSKMIKGESADVSAMTAAAARTKARPEQR